MFENDDQSFTSGRIEIETNERAVNHVIIFLDTYLPHFQRTFQNKTFETEVTHEDKISQMLSTYLNRQCRNEFFMIQFQYQYIETKRSSDFGIITVADHNPNEIDKAFFVIEAKRLPTPGSKREKEYVEGNLGGIERFKRGHHGADLAKSAMIAYIQTETCPIWLNQVNGWIRDLIVTNTAADIEWANDDLLVYQHQSNTMHKYVSVHKRMYQNEVNQIELLHYWLPLS